MPFSLKQIALTLAITSAASIVQAAPATSKEIVADIGAKLNASYPFPAIAARYAKGLAAIEKTGAYNNLADCELATRLTGDLRTIHPDVHLRILCDADYQKRMQPVTASGTKALKGYGFESVEIDKDLATTYIQSKGGWGQSQETFDMAANAMGMAAHAQHVIIDLRSNPGGSGQVGRFLASYFYPAGEEKYYLYGFSKDAAKNQQEWTYAYVPGRRIPDAKLYILVNHRTASATEGFAYAMQKLKRATIIGQTTAGAGIAGSFEPLKGQLMMFLPVKMIVAPNSDQGWEGKGVVPDVETKPDEEKAAAMALIRQRMGSNAPAVGQTSAPK